MKREDFRFTPTSIRDHLEAIQRRTKDLSSIISKSQSSKTDDLNFHNKYFQTHIKVESEWSARNLNSPSRVLKSFGGDSLSVNEHLTEIEKHTESALEMLCGYTQPPKLY